MGGSSAPFINGGHGGIYGTEGIASTANSPGSRESSASWVDSSGNLWLFGGYGFSAEGAARGEAGIGYLNDLWEYNPAAGTWAWIDGANDTSGNFGSAGIYGTLGVPSPSNVPGGRVGAVSWTDDSGIFWMFGGYGFDSLGEDGALNDLWSFNPNTKEWTWVSGSSVSTAANGTKGLPGIYGSLGVPAAGNVPGGRGGAVSWIGSDGNLWLFGGNGFDGNDIDGELNDLWEFNPSAKMWTWMGGSNTIGPYSSRGQPGVYGTQGTASTKNIPGGRDGAAGWVDKNGDFWLFGGNGIDSTGTLVGPLNDLWMFDPTAKTWTWVSGSETSGASGVYGTQGTAAAGDMPGARAGSAGWVDSQDNLWLFGGSSFNDLWKFSPATGTWTWMNGSNALRAIPDYGTLSVAATSNMPSGRAGAVTWAGKNNTYWMFGGDGYDSTDSPGLLNDLWRYQP